MKNALPLRNGTDYRFEGDAFPCKQGRALWCNKTYTGVKFHEHIPRDTMLAVHKA